MILFNKAMTTNQHMSELKEVILELKNDIQRMVEKQAEIQEDVKKIKEAVYNPDSGLYARLKLLEQWKASTSKIQSAIGMTVVGLAITTIYKAIIGQ